jgi:hypothetical protein
VPATSRARVVLAIADIARVYRALVMFPKSADPAEVDTLIENIAASLKASTGSQQPPK